MANNETFFYLTVQVKDDIVASSESDARGFFYDQDAIRLYFRGHDGIRTLFIVLKPDHQDGAICLTQDTMRDVLFIANVTENSRVLANMFDNGYQIKARIPWLAMDLRPAAGDVIAFDLELYDCDDRLDGVKTVLAWAGRERRNEYDASVFGSIKLSEASIDFDNPHAGKDCRVVARTSENAHDAHTRNLQPRTVTDV